VVNSPKIKLMPPLRGTKTSLRGTKQSVSRKSEKLDYISNPGNWLLIIDKFS